MYNEMDEDDYIHHGVLNPNQRQFLEDEKRYKEKIEQLQAGKVDIKIKWSRVYEAGRAKLDQPSYRFR